MVEWSILGGTMEENEKQAYVDRCIKFYGKKPRKIIAKIEGEDVSLEYIFEKIPFDRMRRITGYLVGHLDRWNDHKKVELGDRVSHI